VDVGRASGALEDFRSWLEQRLPGLSQETKIGRDGYVFFLRKVALLALSPEQIRDGARLEAARAKGFELIAQVESRPEPRGV
jgi:hypothetical protein